MSTNGKKTGQSANRFIAMTWENAIKSTEEYLKTWEQKRPIDPREFVLQEKLLFRDALQKGFDPAAMRDYLHANFEIEKSMSYCKSVIKELKTALSKNGEKPAAESAS